MRRIEPNRLAKDVGKGRWPVSRDYFERRHYQFEGKITKVYVAKDTLEPLQSKRCVLVLFLSLSFRELVA